MELGFSIKFFAMAKKILFGIIGALVAFFVFILAVLLLNSSIGFQAVTVLELGLNIIIGFVCWKKFSNKKIPATPTNKMISSFSLGVLSGSIFYLVLIFIAKTIAFSLLAGITG